MGEIGVHREPPGGADDRDEQRGCGDPPDRGDRPADQKSHQERDRRERQGDLLDQEGDREDQARQKAAPHRAAPDGIDADDHVAEGEGRCRDIEPGRPGQVMEIGNCQATDHGEGRHGGSDPPGQGGDREEQADSREGVEEVAPGERVDPEPDPRRGDDHRPQGRVRQEDGPEHGPRAVPGEHAVTDPEVLRLVEGAVERRHESEQPDECRNRQDEDDGGAASFPALRGQHRPILPRAADHPPQAAGSARQSAGGSPHGSSTRQTRWRSQRKQTRSTRAAQAGELGTIHSGSWLPVTIQRTGRLW